MRSLPVAALAGALLALGCFTPVTDPNYWDISRGEFQRFLADSDACEYEATPRLQPELPQEVNPDAYRRCMEGHGWRRR
jgi:hypothetical protein